MLAAQQTSKPFINMSFLLGLAIFGIFSLAMLHNNRFTQFHSNLKFSKWDASSPRSISSGPCPMLLTATDGSLSGKNDSWTPSNFPHFKLYKRSSGNRCLRTRWSLNLTNIFIFMGDSTMLLRANVLAQMFGITDVPMEDSFSVQDRTMNARVTYYRNEMLQEIDLPKINGPVYFIFGSNLWYQKVSPTGFAPHQKHLDLGVISDSAKLGIYLNRLHKWARRIADWHPRLQAIFVYQDLVMPGHKGVTNAGISAYNEAAAAYLKQNFPKVIVWRSGRAISDRIFLTGVTELMFDSIHLCGEVYQTQLQLLMNLLCSEHCVP